MKHSRLILFHHFYHQTSMSQDQNEDQRVFQQKQRELLMGAKDLSKHSIQADSNDLEESLQRGKTILL
jgi:hypothetical protein